MKLDALLAPISEDAPCGPDLFAAQDPAFDNYYLGALGRLPGFYFQPGVDRPDGSRTPDRLFDASSVDHASEAKAIDALLARSRDLRLLVLRTQWEALSGRLAPMANAVEAIAALLETHGDHVHPGFEDGVSERRDALGDLNQQITICQPLLFYSLTGSGEVTLRKLRAAQNPAGAGPNDVEQTAAAMLDMMGEASNRKRLDDAHTALCKLHDCFQKIDNVCQTHATMPFSPSLNDVRRIVSEMIDAIGSARPELMSQASVEDEPELASEEASPLPLEAPLMPASDIVSHDHARAVLEACEHYYRRFEPSSAALLLVTQARLLIGKPLIEALETLLPAQAAQALVDFGPQTGFALNIERLRSLTGSAPDSPAPDVCPPAGVPDVPAIEESLSAAAAMRSVEDYFRQAERSSPVPILLQRARSYLEKDFQSLVDELIPRQTEA